ncbi:MAG: glycosyltransferase family 4 protein [Candidatus Sumerlaeia bacterium]
MRMLMIMQRGRKKASSRVRGWQLVEPLRACGVEVRHLCLDDYPGEGGSLGRWWRRWRFLRNLRALQEWANVVFAQRLIKHRRPLRIILNTHRPLVYDFDDALFDHPVDADGQSLFKAQASGAGDPEWMARQQWFLRFVKRADLCSLTPSLLDWLKEKYPRKKYVAYLGPVNTSLYRPNPKSREKCIGWVGSPSTAPYLREIEDPIHAILDEHPDWKFLVLGAQEKHIGWKNPPRAEYVEWSIETEPVQLQRMAIGINPLPDNTWTRGKGAYKVLQYMASGIPSVASPVGVNRDLMEDAQSGMLAPDAVAWHDALAALMTQPDRREKLGREARRRAEEKHAIPVCAKSLVQAIEEIRKG